MNDHDFDDFEAETKVYNQSMAEIMESLGEEVVETVRSPGIPTLTSDRPTKPMRPAIINRMEDEREAG